MLGQFLDAHPLSGLMDGSAFRPFPPESDRAADIVNALRHIPECNFIHEKIRGIAEKDGVV